MNIDQLINRLAAEGAQKPLPHPIKQAAFWLFGTVVYLVMLSSYSGLRSDVNNRLDDPVYALELALLSGVAVSASFAALCLSRPDSYQMPYLKYVSFGFLAGWALAAFTGSESFDWNQIFDAMTLGQIDCVWHITLFSLPPAIAIFMIARRGATIQWCWAGGMATLAVTAFAYLCMRLIEQTDNPAHLIVWHAMPILSLCVLGMMAGMFLLRWR